MQLAACEDVMITCVGTLVKLRLDEGPAIKCKSFIDQFEGHLYLYLYKSAKLTMGLQGYDYYLDQPTRYHHMRLHANVPPSNSS